MSLSQKIKQHARQLGFMDCGIAAATELTDEAKFLEQWLNQNMHGEMHYMANHFEKRIDPRKLVEGAKSVISLSYNYYTSKKQLHPEAPKIAMYAFGKDYHLVVKEKLNQLLAFIEQQAGKINARCFVDSAPVLERAWAKRAGIGWVGKNTNLLTKRAGSFFFLAEIICDLPLDYDLPVKDYCGSCSKCMDACPTQAIFEPYKLDASKCISYLTIELKSNNIPESFKGKFDNWAFGCDICQQVCPINSQSKPHSEPQFEPNPQMLGLSANDWHEMTSQQFNQLFKNSPLKRTKFSGLKRNLDFLKNDQSQQ